MNYSLEDFNYNLPKNLIANYPSKARDHSRLLVLNKKSGKIEHSSFHNLIDILNKGDVLVLNNSKVFPARLLGNKEEGGGKVEVFLHKKIQDDNNFSQWECLIKGRVRTGKTIILSKKLEAKVDKNNQDGTFILSFNLSGKKFFKELNKIGKVPLPPYIKREEELKDRKRYQTVYASEKKIGSVAAPTAGLHFSKGLLNSLKKKGVIIKYITLHVGMGTFAPVKVDDIREHKMHSEYVEIEQSVIQEIKRAKQDKRRIVAVGTTTCRALESAGENLLNSSENKQALSFWTDIFIYPGYKFKIIDTLVTNFHLPKSTLLFLISAFAGKDLIDKAYQEAIDQEYRFFSYGDAMIIV